MNNKKSEWTTVGLVRHAMIIAILILMEITNIGYIKTPTGLELTIMQIPVLVGAITMGPNSGALFGGVFGLTSLWQAITGKSFFGATLFGISPFGTIIMCLVPRILMGYFCGLVFKVLHKKFKKGIVPFAAASLSGALLNTLFFMAALILIFGRTDYIMGFRGSMGIIKFVIAFVGVQGLIEAILCFAIGTAISKVIYRYAKR